MLELVDPDEPIELEMSGSCVEQGKEYQKGNQKDSYDPAQKAYVVLGGAYHFI